MAGGEQIDQPLRQVGDRQHPRKGRGGGKDEQQHAGQRGRAPNRAQEIGDSHLAVDEHGEDDAVDDGERGDLGRRGEAEENPGEQHARHQQGQNRIEPGARNRPQRGAGSGERAGATGADTR